MGEGLARGSRLPGFVLFVLFGSLANSFALAEPTEPIPHAYPASRYQTIWENSPFELEAPPPTNTGPESSLSDEFALVGVTRVRGKRVVTLLDKKAGTSFDLREDESRNDLKILSVIMKADPLLTEVRLSKGSVTGAVGYDKKSVVSVPKRPAQAVAPNPQAGRPGVPSVPGGPQQSVLNRSPLNPNPVAPTAAVARRRILAPTVPSPQAPGSGAVLPQGAPPPMALPLPGGAQPEIPQPRQPPTVGDRRQIIVPR